MRHRFCCLLLILTACGNEFTSDATLAGAIKRPELDVLFVIDNSNSMKAVQEQALAAFDSFTEGLGDPATRPDLHIGVISTDLGGNTAIANCEGGDNGQLQNTPRIAGCQAPKNQPYIIDGDARNYDGSLAETFECIALLGTAGCGFEQPLESVKRALNGSQAKNAGFVRPNAALAIILLTDEDDCSVFDPGLFDNSAASVPTLGPLTSFRCFEFGVVCEPDDARVPGLKKDCKSREDSPFVRRVSQYAHFLPSEKPADKLLVATFAVPADTVAVELDDSNQPRLSATCNGGNGAPAVRLSGWREKLDSFGVTTAGFDLCAGNFNEGMLSIGKQAAALAD